MSEQVIDLTAGIQLETNLKSMDPDVGGVGTLGCFATDSQNRPVLLSNAHTLFPNFQRSPTLAVHSPDFSTCCSGGPRIGRPIDVAGFNGFKQVTVAFTMFEDAAKTKVKQTGTSTGSETDCAIALLDPKVKFRNVYLETPTKSIIITGAVASPASIPLGPPLGTMPTEPELVRVLTRRGVIFGTVMSDPRLVGQYQQGGSGAVPSPLFPLEVFGDDDVKAGARTNVNQLIILPRPTRNPGENFQQAYARGADLTFQKGDSGSVVIDNAGRVVGLLCRMFPGSKLGLDPTKTEFRKVGTVGIANAITMVQSALGISIPSAPAGFSGTVPGAGAAVIQLTTPEQAAHARGVEQLRDGLRCSRRGRLLLEKINRHHREVRQLFASVRVLSTAWRLLRGPAFHHACLASLRSPGHLIPRSIDGVTREQLAGELLPVLERHASPALARDLTRYRAWAAAVLLHVATLDDVPAAAARPWRPT